MTLYHGSNTEVAVPRLLRSVRTLDFGPGFYLTPDMDFAYRWAGANAVVNEYELDEEGLRIHRFRRGEDWFHYIFHNRRAEDSLSADVVIGPIANDTIFETLGIISSGFLQPSDAMKLLMIGPEYTQVALKTEKAVRQLRWLRAEKITKWNDEQRRAEQAAYDADFARVLNEITEAE